MKEWIKAIDSAWRAGLRQYRRMRTIAKNRKQLRATFTQSIGEPLPVDSGIAKGE